jgi:hypothetical protein
MHAVTEGQVGQWNQRVRVRVALEDLHWHILGVGIQVCKRFDGGEHLGQVKLRLV